MDRFSEAFRMLDGKVITFGKSSTNYRFTNMEYDIEQTIFDLLVDDNIFHIFLKYSKIFHLHLYWYFEAIYFYTN